jgi:stringent starvation protein B
MNALESTSTRPYLIRALYEWCTDNGFTPYVAVLVDETVQVPREYVKNGEIVLNISYDATSSLKLGNDFIEFKARFAGSAREIMVPVNRVIAIYARENGQGMAFPMPSEPTTSSDPAEGQKADAPAPSPRGPRLAGSNNAATRKGGTALTLSPTPALPSKPASDPPPEPPPASPPTGPKRPSLKRVK